MDANDTADIQPVIWLCMKDRKHVAHDAAGRYNHVSDMVHCHSTVQPSPTLSA